jgi:hypothetical protein
VDPQHASGKRFSGVDTERDSEPTGVIGGRPNDRSVASQIPFTAYALRLLDIVERFFAFSHSPG